MAPPQTSISLNCFAPVTPNLFLKFQKYANIHDHLRLINCSNISSHWNGKVPWHEYALWSPCIELQLDPIVTKRSMPIRGVCKYAKLTLKGVFNRIMSAEIHVQNQENRHDDSCSCLLLMSKSPFPNLAMVGRYTQKQPSLKMGHKHFFINKRP